MHRWIQGRCIDGSECSEVFRTGRALAGIPQNNSGIALEWFGVFAHVSHWAGSGRHTRQQLSNSFGGVDASMDPGPMHRWIQGLADRRRDGAFRAPAEPKSLQDESPEGRCLSELGVSGPLGLHGEARGEPKVSKI